MIGIGIHHGHAIGADNLVEQPQLGGEIAFEIGVIIEMIARQVGEGGSGDIRAIEAELVETMAGGFQRQMFDAIVLQLREQAVDFHRVGRGVFQRDFARGRDDADGAQAGGALAEHSPDLAQEHRDRGFAVGAGDGGDCFGLRAIEFGRRARQSQARVFIGDEAHAQFLGVAGRIGARQNGDRAALHRVGHEFGAVRLRSRKGCEQIALFHLAAVARKACEILHRLHFARTRLTRCNCRLRMWSHYEFSLASARTGSFGTPRIGAMRAITWPARGAAVWPASDMIPPLPPCGSSSNTNTR